MKENKKVSERGQSNSIWMERERERHAYVGKNENFKERIIQ